MGTIGLLFYYFLGLRTNYARYTRPQLTSLQNIPTYRYSITGEKEFLSAPLNATIAFGLVYVTDSGNSEIDIFTKEGGLLRSFPLRLGMEAYYPRDIMVDKFNRIYVSVAEEKSLVVFDKKGKFRYLFPQTLVPRVSQDQEKKPLVTPVGLFYSEEKLYVTDVGTHQVKVFNTTGKLLLTIGKPGDGRGEFTYPNGIVADKDGIIYVADSNNSRVQVFDAKGKFLYFLAPVGKETFSLPRGIAIDNLNRLHIVDTMKHKVFVFTNKGKFLFTYGRPGDTEDSLFYPNGIAIDQQTGLIFIADRANNRIAVWGE